MPILPSQWFAVPTRAITHDHCGGREEVLACRGRHLIQTHRRFRVRIFAEHLRGSRQHVRSNEIRTQQAIHSTTFNNVNIPTGLLPRGIIEVAAAFKFQPITLRSCLGGELEFDQWFILVRWQETARGFWLAHQLVGRNSSTLMDTREYFTTPIRNVNVIE